MNCYPWMEMRETRWHRPDMRYEGTLSAMARQERWAGGANKRRTLSYFMIVRLVAPAGFEPAISALKGPRPRPLDDGATLGTLVAGLVCEPLRATIHAKAGVAQW